MNKTNFLQINKELYRTEIEELYNYFFQQNTLDNQRKQQYQNYLDGKETNPEERFSFEIMDILNKIGLDIFDKKAVLYLDLIKIIYNSSSDLNNYDYLKIKSSELYFKVARETNDVGIKTFHELIDKLFENIDFKNNDYILESFPEEEIKNPSDLAFLIAMDLKHQIYRGSKKIIK